MANKNSGFTMYEIIGEDKVLEMKLKKSGMKYEKSKSSIKEKGKKFTMSTKEFNKILNGSEVKTFDGFSKIHGNKETTIQDYN